jgi:hypothetical protein
MAWIKEQYTKANGKKYGPYYYIYKTYYESGMDYPRQIKLGKVGDSPSDLASSFRSKAESKGWSISEDEIQELENTVEQAQSQAEDDEDIAEFIERETEDDKVEEDGDEETEDDSEDDSDGSEKSYGGIGGGRRKKLDKIEEFDKLKTLEKSDIGSKEDIERFIEDMSVPGVASARGSHVDLQDLLDRLDKMYGDLPNDEAKDAYVNDTKLFRTLRSTRRHFNKLIDKERSFAEMPSAVEAGPAKYPSGKRDKKRKSLRKQKEKVEEKVDRLYGRLKGARQRALQSIGSSVGEQNEKKRADTREEQRERFEKGMMAEFFHGVTSYGRIKRVNKKSVTFEYYRNKPREEGYEFASLRIDMPSDRYTVVESVKLTEDAVKEIDEEAFNLIRDMDSSEVPETVDADFLESIRSEEEEESGEEEEEPEETVVLKKENDKGEVDEYDVPESKAEDRADALIDAPHGTVEKIWIDGEVYYERSEEDDENFDSKEAVKQLTKEGAIVGRDASEIIGKRDVRIIENLDTTPMYISEEMIRNLRKTHEGDDISGELSPSSFDDFDGDYQKVEIIGDVPEFMGVDGEVYEGFSKGDRVELPVANAEILVNRGIAEKVEEEQDSSVKNDDWKKDLTVYRVHSVWRPYKDKVGGTHDSWSLIKYDGQDVLNGSLGEAEEEIDHKDKKKPIKENARRLAEENKPSVIVFENRDSEFIRNEIYVDDEEIESEIEKIIEEGFDDENASNVKNEKDDFDGNKEDKDILDNQEWDGDTAYVEVEFLKKTPEFMGTDLENYGSYEEGDTDRIPRENAEILENRGNVEVKGGIANVAEEHNQSKADKDGQDSSSQRDISENVEGMPEGFGRLMNKVRDWIEENETEDEGAVIEDLNSRPEGIMAWAEINGWSEDQVMEAMDRLKARGELYEPAPGMIKTI